jgi:ubiquinone/menaquinone biosynthesis C-methylase UbiE
MLSTLFTNNKHTSALNGIVKPAPVDHNDSFATQAQKRTEQFVDPTKTVHDFGIRQGQLVADIGCGSGHYVPMLAHAVGDKGHVYALDIHKDMLTRAERETTRQGFKNISYIWGNAEQNGGTKLKDALLDVSLLSNILFQTEDDRGLFREMHRVLKGDGRLIVIDWLDSFSGMGPHRHHVYTKGQALSRAHEAGFTLLSEFFPGKHHYGLI